MSKPRVHPFSAVDEQADRATWVAVLDAVRRVPGYAAYKQRMTELLRPRLGGRYLEVGVGTGEDALAFEAAHGVQVVGVDAAQTMVDEARRRGLQDVLAADAHTLPFEDASFDGAWADRVLQHLEDPRAALGELVRVTKLGARIVVADPDWDTQVVDVPDQDLARRVLRWRADYAQRNGTIAHRSAGILSAIGCTDVVVEAAPIVLQDAVALDNALGLRDWAGFAHEEDLVTADEVESWQVQLDEASEAGRFLYAFTIFVTAGERSATR
jgi:SAM-dependent methyltransferase